MNPPGESTYRYCVRAMMTTRPFYTIVSQYRLSPTNEQFTCAGLSVIGPTMHKNKTTVLFYGKQTPKMLLHVYTKCTCLVMFGGYLRNNVYNFEFIAMFVYSILLSTL